MIDPIEPAGNAAEKARGPVRAALWHVLSFAAGLAIALILDYVLYRMGLPGKPFIYVAF